LNIFSEVNVFCLQEIPNNKSVANGYAKVVLFTKPEEMK
jgi:hypothetical protein